RGHPGRGPRDVPRSRTLSLPPSARIRHDRNLLQHASLPRFHDLLLRRRNDVLGGEAELPLQFLERRRRAERLHADAVPSPADILRPAESGALFHRDARADRLRQHRLTILGMVAAIVLEHLPCWHTHPPCFYTFGLER